MQSHSAVAALEIGAGGRGGRPSSSAGPPPCTEDPTHDTTITQALDRILAEVEHLRGQVPSQDPANPAAAAFRRLLRRSGSASDAAALPIPIHGARLIALETTTRALGETLAQRLEDGTTCLALAEGNMVLVLVSPRVRQVSDDASLHAARRVFEYAQRHTPLRGAISAALTTPETVGRAARDARDALHLTQRSGDVLVLVPDLWAALASQRLVTTLGDALPHGNPLESMGERSGRAVAGMATLLLWLRADCDMQRTSRQLGIHVNTARYRIQRVLEEFSLDVSDPRERAVLLLWAESFAAQSLSDPASTVRLRSS